MTISATYLTLQEQIADELGNRTDLLSPLSGSGLTLSPVKNAIQSAISRWEREPFYFNQFILNPVTSPGTFNTVNGQEYYDEDDYAAIATWAKIRKLWVLISANRYTLNERTPQYLDDVSVSPTNSGQPSDYSYAYRKIRLYPIPNGAYPVGAEAIQRFTALSADGDTNCWTTDACDLIRAEAKLILAEEVLHDEDMAGLMKRAIYGDPENPKRRGYLYDLKAESARRGARGKIRPTQF